MPRELNNLRLRQANELRGFDVCSVALITGL
jgi:hypothetical protein